jgi:BirA family biotin operon repressor/biotin-[acetyl-CoA-carboxylase] ligase
MKEILSADTISEGLTTQILGRSVVYYESVGSTNEVAKELARQGAPNGTLIAADFQTAGKGRQRRSWVAPPGSSLLFSLILYPSFTSSRLPHLTMAGALAVAQAVEKSTRISVHFKWPNDVLLRGKKAGGILIEASITGQMVNYAILGVGLNVNLDVRQIPEIADTATSLSGELGDRVSRVDLLQVFLEFMEKEYRLLEQGKSPHERWAARLPMLGQMVEVATPWGTESGRAEAVDAEGSLILRRNDGTAAHIAVGDVQ